MVYIFQTATIRPFPEIDISKVFMMPNHIITTSTRDFKLSNSSHCYINVNLTLFSFKTNLRKYCYLRSCLTLIKYIFCNSVIFSIVFHFFLTYCTFPYYKFKQQYFPKYLFYLELSGQSTILLRFTLKITASFKRLNY